MKHLLLSALMTGGLVASSSLAKIATTENLHTLATAYINSQLDFSEAVEAKVIIKKLDSRFKLRDCNKNDLSFFIPHHKTASTTSSVGVRCEKSAEWVIYMPVTIKKYMNVVLAKHPITKNKQISSNDVYLKRVALLDLRSGYYTDINEVVGRKAKTSLQANHVIRPNATQLPLAVKKGQAITIIGLVGNAQVRVGGVALSHGRIDDRIHVKNINSKKTVVARIVDREHVIVEF